MNPYFFQPFSLRHLNQRVKMIGVAVDATRRNEPEQMQRSAAFFHFFCRFFSTIPMESFSNVNGIVEQIQWNRSTKSMALLPETVSFIARNPQISPKKLPFPLVKAVCKQRHRLCLLPVKQVFPRLLYVPSESTKKKTWKTLFL